MRRYSSIKLAERMTSEYRARLYFDGTELYVDFNSRNDRDARVDVALPERSAYSTKRDYVRAVAAEIRAAVAALETVAEPETVETVAEPDTVETVAEPETIETVETVAELQGSAKQVAWATEIREKFAEKIADEKTWIDFCGQFPTFAAKFLTSRAALLKAIEDVKKALAQVDSARELIDNRVNVCSWIRLAVSRIYKIA